MTPEEEREARELARQFVEHLREHNDVSPLVEELFVGDFASRLRRERKELPMLFVAPEAAARAGDDELKRFYVAEFNFFSRTFAYWMTRAQSSGGSDQDDEDGDSDALETWYPPDVLGVLKDDPFMAAAIAQAERPEEEEEEQAAEDKAAGAGSERRPREEDERYIKDLFMLRSAAETMGKAAGVLRAHAAEFSALRRAQEASVPQGAFEDIHVMFIDTREEEYLGYPPGTRLIRVNVEPAHDVQFALTLVREDGGLRVLHAFPCFGD
jgi:hypothetical protein